VTEIVISVSQRRCGSAYATYSNLSSPHRLHYLSALNRNSLACFIFWFPSSITSLCLNRDSEIVMRGLKRTGTVLLTGYQLYHNYFRPHEAVKGKTPAEKCGIIIEGENKWKTVIENASRK
jgi:hypothetical protein